MVLNNCDFNSCHNVEAPSVKQKCTKQFIPLNHLIHDLAYELVEFLKKLLPLCFSVTSLLLQELTGLFQTVRASHLHSLLLFPSAEDCSNVKFTTFHFLVLLGEHVQPSLRWQRNWTVKRGDDVPVCAALLSLTSCVNAVEQIPIDTTQPDNGELFYSF